LTRKRTAALLRKNSYARIYFRTRDVRSSAWMAASLEERLLVRIVYVICIHINALLDELLRIVRLKVVRLLIIV
jgi:hypothetical protein